MGRNRIAKNSAWPACSSNKVLASVELTTLNARARVTAALLRRGQLGHACIQRNARPAHIDHRRSRSGLEGIVSKRADSVYRGNRNGDWVKAKGRPSDEFVVIGFTEPKSTRAGIGALLLAKPKDGKLVYVGRVGTGLTDEQLRTLRKQLNPAVVTQPGADISLMARADQKLAIWVKPKLVVEIFFQGIGSQGLLRQPAFKAMRPDKDSKDLGVEPPQATKKSARARARGEPEGAMGAIVLTHPEREVFAGTGITKADVAAYYRAVAPYLLPELAGRPISVVRCPEGAGEQCFFQKHVTTGWGKHIHAVTVKEAKGAAKYLSIQDAAGLIELVQMNVLELHPWGAKSEDLEHADRIVFDLDPHPTVKWSRVVKAARDVRTQLESIGLQSFLRTSGGKGLHVVVPLNPPALWSEVKGFAQAVAQALSGLRPKEFVSVAGEKNREGKIFIDWLRNGRGATSVASYSLRARPGAGVAMPLFWDELGRVRSGDAFTIKNAIAKITKRASDPWAGIDTIKQSLPDI